MHGHAMQFDPNLQMRELYAMRLAEAKQTADVRKKLRFASVLGGGSMCEEEVQAGGGRGGSQGDERRDERGRKEDERAFEKEKKLSALRPAGGSFSGWA